jgi:DNA-binding beta-propeller fold protein YncE
VPLNKIATIELTSHIPGGGFDHAAYHAATGNMYVAHTSNDSLDKIDCRTDRYLESLSGLKGIAGALVSDTRNLVFTSNRGEDSISIFTPGLESEAVKVGVGVRPNGLSFDPERGLLLVANVGRPEDRSTFSLTLVDVVQKKKIAEIATPGRTRWTVFDPIAELFYVNVGDPAEILILRPDNLTRIEETISIPSRGPHGLDLDMRGRRLFCACDSGELITIDLNSRTVLSRAPLSGVPDVTFFNSARDRLYVAVGNPGVIDVFDTKTMTRIQSVLTGEGAHTIGVDFDRNKIYAFLPESHSALVFQDM